ncbi:MAG TPA: MFS transporter [Coriobacteriia bacterium]|nr:MFS transporter [Coriobacteriia bacterium]
MKGTSSAPQEQVGSTAAAVGTVLLILGAAQFLMVLDTSVMNVSIVTVAEDVGTTVTGIQGAITLFTLVMATLMITGGKLGTIYGRRRIFNIGLVIYAIGSLTTALAPNLTVLLIGWSLLEGMGAALIMPAIVALVAGNVAADQRPRAYGLIAAAGAVAVAVGPLIGGAATTYFSWRWVFAGEVLIAATIFVMARRLADAPNETKARIDLVGTLFTIVGLGSIVYGVLRSSEWGWVMPKAGAPSLAGVSPTLWLIILGILVIWLFGLWERRVLERGGEPLVLPGTLKNVQLSGGLMMFFFQFLLQGGYFFIVPLFLSVVLELNALETGVRLVPLSLALIFAAAGIPKAWPMASPRRVVRIGVSLMLVGLVTLLAGIDLDASAAVVAVPMLLMGLGMGALASQLGAVAVSALPSERSGEVGGLQNTASNLGVSLGTALAGSVLIAALTTSFISGIQQNPQVPAEVKSQASVELAAGIPFISDTDLESAMVEAGASDDVVDAVVAENSEARVTGLKSALAILALLAMLSLFFTDRIPTTQGATSTE